MKNLIARTLSGLLFLLIMTGAILYSSATFWAISCIIVAVGMYEFFEMTIPKSDDLQKGISILTGITAMSIFNPIFINFAEAIILIVICLFATIPIIELYRKTEKPFENISLLILPIFYIAAPFALMNAIHLQNSLYVLIFFIFVWANDVGAYCFGMLFGQHGRHKLFPRISPKKSWEGFLGGIAMAIIASVLISKFMLEGKNLCHWIIISIITAVAGTFGDLIESMLKRGAGVKDSGKIIPGHGGILDRFDAALLALPIVFAYILTYKI
jgi:phosphatidate cytidylyltransferase